MSAMIAANSEPTDKQARGSKALSDDLRHKLLKGLLKYSSDIPHPASTSDDSLDLKDNSENNLNVSSQDNPHKLSNTLIRWQILAYVASIDLTLVKWFESHLDAISILHEVGYEGSTQGLWAVWAAEGPPLDYQNGKLNGIKAWCSGAHIVDYGLITYRDEDNRSQLLIVDMQQEGIELDNSSWQAVGMQATDTATIMFRDARADPVGAANAYLDRSGFWHGAAGVAACWYGAAMSLANYLQASYQSKPNDFKAMYLGSISTELSILREYFYHVAALMERQPKQSHELAIRQLRAHTEQVARQVVDATGQALGATPFCTQGHFARLSADLLVFIRQSHGAFDLQKIGELACARACTIDGTEQDGSDTASAAAEERGLLWQL